MSEFDTSTIALEDIIGVSEVRLDVHGFYLTVDSSIGVVHIYMALSDSQLLAEMYHDLILACEAYWEKLIPWERRYT